MAQRTAAAVRSYRTTGAAANPPPLSDFTRAYGLEQGTQRYRQLADAQSQGRQMKIFAALPSADIERARNDAQAGLHATARANADMLGTPAPAGTGESGDSAFALRMPQGDVADPHYAAQSRAANTQSAAAILTARQQDPVKAGIDAGAFGLKAADMRTPQAVLASAASRAPVVGVLADSYNTGRTVFTNSEFADLGKTAAAMPAQERGAFFKQLADTLGEPDLVRATFKRLGADSPVLAAAARMQFEEQATQPGPTTGASGVISAPEQMYRGFTALNPADGSEAQAMPPETEMRAAFTPGQGDEDPGTTETRYQATRAIYASLAQQDGDKSGAFDATRWRVAQRMATQGSGTAGEVGLGAQLPTTTSGESSQSSRPSQQPNSVNTVVMPEASGGSNASNSDAGGFQAPIRETTVSSGNLPANGGPKQTPSSDPYMPEVQNPDGSWTLPQNLQAPTDNPGIPEVLNSDGSMTLPGPISHKTDEGLFTGIEHPITKLSDEKILDGREKSGLGPSFGQRVLDGQGASLDFSTASVDKASRHIDVQVKVNYQNPGKMTEEDLSRKIALANAGIQKYWSRNVTLNGEVWSVNVAVVNSSGGMSINLENKNSRSYNGYPYKDGTIYYGERDRDVSPDEQFSKNAAHEVGHAFLTAAFGKGFSWDHEGTSEGIVGQNMKSTAPDYPPVGEVGLTPYYHDNIVSDVKPKDALARTIASQNDVKTMIYISGRNH